jgi:hypothetical protein
MCRFQIKNLTWWAWGTVSCPALPVASHLDGGTPGINLRESNAINPRIGGGGAMEHTSGFGAACGWSRASSCACMFGRAPLSSRCQNLILHRGCWGGISPTRSRSLPPHAPTSPSRRSNTREGSRGRDRWVIGWWWSAWVGQHDTATGSSAWPPPLEGGGGQWDGSMPHFTFSTMQSAGRTMSAAAESVVRPVDLSRRESGSATRPPASLHDHEHRRVRWKRAVGRLDLVAVRWRG